MKLTFSDDSVDTLLGHLESMRGFTLCINKVDYTFDGVVGGNELRVRKFEHGETSTVQQGIPLEDVETIHVY